MGRPIIKLPDGRYLEWSTVADGPTTYSLEREEAVEEWTEERIARADRFGTSSFGAITAESMTLCNRSGPNGSWLSLEEICKAFHPDNAPKEYAP